MNPIQINQLSDLNVEIGVLVEQYIAASIPTVSCLSVNLDDDVSGTLMVHTTTRNPDTGRLFYQADEWHYQVCLGSDNSIVGKFKDPNLNELCSHYVKLHNSIFQNGETHAKVS